jgi:hypothetical protein
MYDEGTNIGEILHKRVAGDNYGCGLDISTKSSICAGAVGADFNNSRECRYPLELERFVVGGDGTKG